MGDKILCINGGLQVPDRPTIPYIMGDGVGVDITPVMRKVIDAAVRKAYNGKRKISWLRVYAGEDARIASGLFDKELEELYGDELQQVYLPPETVDAIREYTVAIKGPLTTPVGGGFRSLNVSMRQMMELYACVRPVRYYRGVPAPLKSPEEVDLVIFRENTEDVYAGIEWPEGSDEAAKLRSFLSDELGREIREDSAVGVKPISRTATKRLVRAALDFAVSENRRSVTLVHKGNIMKYTEGAFRNWGYEVALEEYRDHVVTEDEYNVLKAKTDNPELSEEELVTHLRADHLNSDNVRSIITSLWKIHGGNKLPDKIVVKDRIADQMFQQLLLRPREYDVIATSNLNGDYLSDAAAAEVGGLGIAPGANINYETGLALFEATHGSAPRHAGRDRVNPSSLILSAVLMLRYMGWFEAADMVEEALTKTFESGTVTYDLHRQMEDAVLVSTSVFGDRIIGNMS